MTGTPVSSQAKNSRAREEWKSRVRTASTPCLPEMHFASQGRIAVTLYYFPAQEMQGDIDNIIKLTIDGMCSQIFIDDIQVERVVVQKFEPDRVFPFSNPSETLVTALTGSRPLLFVRVTDDPHAELI